MRRINMWIEDGSTGEILERLGQRFTLDPNEEVQKELYRVSFWIQKGKNASICWKEIVE